MKTVITESELGSVEIREYSDVLAVLPSDHTQGIEVWHARRLAQLCSPSNPESINDHHQLLIEVPDPTDAEVIDRLRVACIDAWTNR